MKAEAAIMDLVLASASPRRLDLLAQIGITPLLVHSPSINETPLRHELPVDYAGRMAMEKLQTVSSIFPEKVVLAADTVVFCGRTILPKAEDENTARQCLKILSGRRHRVVTAVAVSQGKHVKVKSVITTVRFKRLGKGEIESYMASKEWQGKAGGYAIQGLAAAFIPFISGSYSNVVGLPLVETKGILEGLWSENGAKSDINR